MIKKITIQNFTLIKTGLALYKKKFDVSFSCKFLNFFLYRAITFYYFWYIKFIFLIFSKNLRLSLHSRFFVFTRYRNIRYSIAIRNKVKSYSNAYLLKKLSIVAKWKWKNVRFYNLALKYIVRKNLFKKRILYFYIKGINTLSFLQTYRVWKDFPLERKFIYNIQLNNNYDIYRGKKEQTIKRRLKKRYVRSDLYKA